MKVVHVLVAVAGTACAASIGFLAYTASGTHDRDQRTVSVSTATTAAPTANDGTPSPTEPATESVPHTFLVGPWEVTLLSTDRDAADTIGKGLHPDDFVEVLTTLQVTNSADNVQDVALLDFEFGATDGTQNGYSPWDDWCAGTENDIYAGRVLYLPGETRTVSVCVPVDPRDAAGLETWVAYYDGNNSVGEVELSLPPDGAEWAPRPEESVASLQARALALADRSAVGWGYRLTVSRVTIGEVVDGQRVVSVSLDARPADPSFPLAGYVFSSGIAASGASYRTSICHPGEYWKPFDGSAWTQDVCMTVEAADADSLLLVFEAMYINEASVHLDVRPD